MPDYDLVNCGSFSILTPVTYPCAAWVATNVHHELEYAGGIVIEPRYIQPIVDGLVGAGFTRS